MRIGQLDRRIAFERYTATKDGFGEDVKAWVALTTVWANRADVNDSERESASQVNATLMSRFTIRSSSVTRTLTAKDRISYDGGLWDISGVKETKHGRNRFLEVTATRQSD